MNGIPDHYAALGIDPTADPEVITAAYRALAKKFHPDTGAPAGTASPERFDEIQKAYEVLRTPESRHAYDLALLAATEAELEAHIASKRRVVPRESAADRSAPPPDLGDIRPEPAMPPRPASAATRGRRRSPLPFLVPLLLMMLAGGAAAWFLLPQGPKAPPLPGAQPQVAETVPASPAKPAPAAPAPQPAAPAPAQATAEQPVFGSTGADDNPPEIEEAAASPESIPVPDAPGANVAAKTDKPVFGSTLDAAAPVAAPDVPAADAPPPPLPKAKPAAPVVKQVQKPATQAKPVQKQAAPKPPVQQQPRARLAYQDPPQYYPEPDGYPPPPPGLEPPGYYPPGVDPMDEPPPGFRPPGGGPYRLVIFERQPGRQATAWSAGVVFKSIGKCTRQGVKAVLRRTGGMDPDGTRVWYECQQFSQR
jgi:DnaJ-domain-containing protein 1